MCHPRAAVLALLVVVPLGGCTLARKVEGRDDSKLADRLLAAGFRAVPADTPDKMARLEKMPDRLFTTTTRNGKRYYVLADRGGCKCMYVGNERAYQRNQDLEIKGENATTDRANALAAEDAGSVDRLESFGEPRAVNSSDFPSGTPP